MQMAEGWSGSISEVFGVLMTTHRTIMRAQGGFYDRVLGDWRYRLGTGVSVGGMLQCILLLRYYSLAV